MPDQYQLSREGPTNNEIRIIGIELAATKNRQREVELFMAGMQHTMPDDRYDLLEGRVTVHTSNGDVTVRFPLRPGNYKIYG